MCSRAKNYPNALARQCAVLRKKKPMLFKHEAGAGQSLDAGQQQVKALADQARRFTQQKRQLQARQGMARAQERLRQASKQAN